MNMGNEPLKTIWVADRWKIGFGSPVFIIAEIGYNFNTLDEAMASIDVAAECGADAVKFQTFRAETTVIKSIDFPAEAGGGNQFAEFKRYELSAEWHEKLFTHAFSRGVVPFSTPSHSDDLALLKRIGMPIYKVGSDDLTNIPFQMRVAQIGKPVILSTGMSYLSEVAETVEAIRSTGNNQIVVLQCLSNYPIKDISEVNLNAMRTMSEALGVLTGFSDHTTTLSAPAAAVALGARIYERHFTIDKKLPAPDAALSADPVEMRRIVQMIRETEQMLGRGVKSPAKSEINMRKDTRKSVVFCKKIKAGELIAENDVTIKRPGYGIAPKHLQMIIGRRAVLDVEEDTVVSWDMVQ